MTRAPSTLGYLDDTLPVDCSKESEIGRILQSTERSANYVIFRTDFSVHGVSISQLASFEFQPNDLVVVGPHGEIVPPVALAMRQGVLPQNDGRIMHFDAHYDNSKTADIVRSAVADVLTGADENVDTSLEHLDELIREDIETLYDALRLQFQTISACIISKCQLPSEARIHNNLSLDDYVATRDICLDTTELSSLIAQTDAHLYSVDADISGLRNEFSQPFLMPPDFQELLDSAYAPAAENRFSKCMDYLLSALAWEVERAKATSDAGRQKLYAVSLDRKWVAKPFQFMEQFLHRFYLPLSRAIQK